MDYVVDSAETLARQQRSLQELAVYVVLVENCCDIVLSLADEITLEGGNGLRERKVQERQQGSYRRIDIPRSLHECSVIPMMRHGDRLNAAAQGAPARMLLRVRAAARRS